MIRSYKICVCVTFIITLTVIQTKGEIVEDLKNNYASYLLECSRIHAISLDDIEKLKNKQMPESKEAKCLFACTYKKAGIMNEDGELSVEHVYETSRMVLKDPYELTWAKYFASACQYVNHVNVGEYNKDCERAALIFKCSVEKVPQYKFRV